MARKKGEPALSYPTPKPEVEEEPEPAIGTVEIDEDTGERLVYVGNNTWVEEGEEKISLPTVTAQRGGVQFPTNIKIEVLRCHNVSCRIETFKGSLVMPFFSCPVCVQPGTVVP